MCCCSKEYSSYASEQILMLAHTVTSLRHFCTITDMQFVFFRVNMHLGCIHTRNNAATKSKTPPPLGAITEIVEITGSSFCRRLVQHKKLSPAELFDYCSLHHAAAASHVCHNLTLTYTNTMGPDMLIM